MIMTQDLGVEINLSKSLVSNDGVMEFAKRLVTPDEEFSPLGPKNILGSLRNPAMLSSIFVDAGGKGTELTAQFVKQKIGNIRQDLFKITATNLESLI